ncbi:MAG: flavodoxin domain-containing protein [Rhodococcus sp. (in: high G+C Gram-positive bacteria)]
MSDSIKILFGTESGNTEMVAEDIAGALDALGLSSEVFSMDEVNSEQIAESSLVIITTSTYGEGELPMTASPFHDLLMAERPSLSSVRFAAFGLGDSSYDTYNNAIDILVGDFVELGAVQIGTTGRHDASTAESYSTVAIEWATNTLSAVVA